MTGTRGRIARLTFAGGVGFWLANLAISLTPIAAEYRVALSIPYLPMLIEALFGGLVIALGVSWALVRYPDVLPTSSPILKSLLFSLTALVVATLVIEVPSKLIVNSSVPLRYFLIAAGFNVVRIFVLGLVIGVLQDQSSRQRAGHAPSEDRAA
jgi:hypothetical protein